MVFLLFLIIPVIQAPPAIGLPLLALGLVGAILAFVGLRRQSIEVSAQNVRIRKLFHDILIPIDQFREVRLVPGAPAVVMAMRPDDSMRVIQTSAITALRGSRRSHDANQAIVDEINQVASRWREQAGS